MNVKNTIYRVLQLVSVVIFTWIILVLCIGNFVSFMCKKEFLVANFFLLFFGGCILLLLQKVFLSFNKKYEEKIDFCIKFFAILFFFVQIFTCYNIFFETGWDSGAFIIPAVKTLLAGGDVSGLNEQYFVVYPNNLFLVNIYYLILKVNDILKIFTGQYQLMAIVVCNCLISSITCWLIYLIGRKLLSTEYAVVGYIISIILIGLSPWKVICYSDSFALLFPVLILYIYLEKRINVYVKSVIISILGYLGYCIKPQVLIIVIAIALIEGINKIKKVSKFEIGKLCVTGLVIIVLIGGISGGVKNIYQKEGFVQDSNRSVGLTHYFMMGLNDQTDGVYLEEDVLFSMNCKTSKERTEKNLQVAKERLKAKGIWGYFKFLSKKMLINYNDGTFAWGNEGGFYKVMVEEPNSSISPALRNIYYNDGKYFKVYATIVQGVWLFVILGCYLISVREILKKTIKKELLIMLTALVGITMFELLFEARARYLYIYVPVYILVFEYALKCKKTNKR